MATHALVLDAPPGTPTDDPTTGARGYVAEGVTIARVHRTVYENGTPSYFQDDSGKPFHHTEADRHPDSVTLAVTRAEAARAQEFTSILWQAIEQAGGPRPNSPTHTHVPQVFGPHLLADLPSRFSMPDGLSMTLAGAAFERPGAEEIVAVYRSVPRTVLFERVHRVVPWVNMAAAQLGELSASPLEVLAAVFDSRSIEQAPHLHQDEWYSAIVQIDGAKNWTIGAGEDELHVITRDGDLLLLPEGLAHQAATPASPGHSRHLVFSLCRHTAYIHAA